MILRSPLPELTVPETDLRSYVLGDLGGHEDSVALVDGPTGRSMTYAELARGVDRVAAGLAEQGVRKGDVVALLAPNSPEYPVLFFGALAAGAVATTLNVLYTVDEIAHQLRDSGARILFTWTGGLDRARRAVGENGVRVTEIVVIDGDGTGHAGGSVVESGLRALMATTSPSPGVRITGDDLAVLPYSSGTTGRPKGVMLTHRNLVANTIQSRVLSPTEEGGGGTELAVLPLFHIYGITGIMALGLRQRAKVVTLPRFELEAFLAAAQKHRVTRICVAPPLALLLAKHPAVDAYDLSSVEAILSAAAPLSADVAEAVQKRLGCVVVQGYGLTESSPATHGIPVRRPEIDRGSIGVLLSGVEARVVDPATGEDTPPGSAGELWCRGPNIMRGYLGNDAATAEAVDAEGFLHTGDLVTVSPDGVFHVVDRLKELIKYNGYQVPPAELEALLCTHAGIADAAVIGVPDVDGQELPKAFVVRAEGRGDLDADAVMAYVAERVAPHKKIRRVEFVDAIPKSAAGKILRRELRNRA